MTDEKLHPMLEILVRDMRALNARLADRGATQQIELVVDNQTGRIWDVKVVPRPYSPTTRVVSG